MRFSNHARSQMTRRRIREGEVRTVVSKGRRWHAQGARKFRVDRRTIRKAADEGDDLRRLDGITVVVSETSDLVMTVYRNRKGERVWR